MPDNRDSTIKHRRCQPLTVKPAGPCGGGGSGGRCAAWWGLPPSTIRTPPCKAPAARTATLQRSTSGGLCAPSPNPHPIAYHSTKMDRRTPTCASGARWRVRRCRGCRACFSVRPSSCIYTRVCACDRQRR
jgi:hypothetical protein